MFLSLTGLLIFALLGTLVETARYTVCKNHVSRTIQTATEGLLTEYSRPLYEQYHLFFIESEGTPYARVIAGYVGDTMEAPGKGNKDFLAGHLTNLEVTHKTYLGDDKAAALQQEITDYMGREVTKEGLDKLLKKSSQLQKIEEEAKEIERSVEEEKEEAKLDGQLLEFMKLVDGISVSNGKISCSRDFVKCFAIKEKRGENFSVTEPAVWDKMKRQIDESTRTWKIKDKSAFLAKIRRVRSVTDQAVKKGRELRSAYSIIDSSHEEHGTMVQRILASTSCLQTNQSILQRTEEMLQKRSVADCKEELEQLWKDYDTTSIVFDYTGVQETGGAANPKDSLTGAWNRGILNLVCKDSKKISDKSMKNPDTFAAYYGQQEKKADYENRVQDFTKDDTVKLTGVLRDMGEYAFDEFCLDRYIQKEFGNYIEKLTSWNQVLDYGLEYVVAGKGSDQENLKSVLHRILLIRTVINFMAISGDSAKKAEAEAAALAIVGFTGLQPLITLTKTLILITWSIVESLVDIAALLQQRHVPLMKKASEITTGFSQIFLINHDSIVGRASKLKKESSHSFGYMEYLLLFLASVKQSTRLYRVMDLIQQNMRLNGYPGFQLGTCVYDVKVKGTMSFSAHFFHSAILEKVLGRSLQTYSITKEITVGY